METIIAAIIAAVVSCAIALVSNHIIERGQKIQTNEFYAQLKKQQEQFEAQLELQRTQHTESIREQVRPFLCIKSISAVYENNFLVFIIAFKNVGNGVAINIVEVYPEKEKIECMYSHKYGDKIIQYDCHLPIDYESNCAPINETCQVQIIQREKMIFSNTNTDKVQFGLIFEDIVGNEYHQEFSFYFNDFNGEFYNGKVIECNRVYNYIPQLRQ
ncbi:MULTISPECIES: hypothetical protein [Caproicibacterium]|uniref:Uncharacterized protein n=1 Tax=Caproicibacterium argilliputei TaxID=3030016 RepID=A0AA97DAY2_9FIRM|nr:hypothetical protein [Caproicibacterium argilliputei]WOC33499.1 hypothetical protein PXC00_06430 [Caproicibacterium argilliputei]